MRGGDGWRWRGRSLRIGWRDGSGRTNCVVEVAVGSALNVLGFVKGRATACGFENGLVMKFAGD